MKNKWIYPLNTRKTRLSKYGRGKSPVKLTGTCKNSPFDVLNRQAKSGERVFYI